MAGQAGGRRHCRPASSCPTDAVYAPVGAAAGWRPATWGTPPQALTVQACPSRVSARPPASPLPRPRPLPPPCPCPSPRPCPVCSSRLGFWRPGSLCRGTAAYALPRTVRGCRRLCMPSSFSSSARSLAISRPHAYIHAWASAPARRVRACRQAGRQAGYARSPGGPPTQHRGAWMHLGA